MRRASLAIGVLGACLFATNTVAAEISVLTAGAMKAVVLAIADDFQKATSHTLVVNNDTAGGLQKRIEGGAKFDVAIITPAVVSGLAKKGLIAGDGTPVSRVGVGVMVKAGAPSPDVSTVEAFKRAVIAAKTVGYIDPASGGSSGIYLSKLWEQLGIADVVKPKAKLKQGGYVADLVAAGEAELGIHQISEILPVAGVTLVGPLPSEIQNYTVYFAGIGATAANADAAKALVQWLAGPQTAAVLKAKGMDRPPS